MFLNAESEEKGVWIEDTSLIVNERYGNKSKKYLPVKPNNASISGAR